MLLSGLTKTKQRPAALRLAVVAICISFVGGNAFAQEAKAPRLLDRVAWGAKAAKTDLMKPHKPYSIIVHHTGERQRPKTALTKKLQGLQGFAQGQRKMADGRVLPPWGDLPYRFYIGSDGAIGEGRDVNFAGDTNTNYNPVGHIQVVLEGNFEVEKPTPEQLEALKQVLAWQAARWKVPISTISVHRDHAQTACPGKNLLAELPGVLKQLDPNWQPQQKQKKKK